MEYEYINRLLIHHQLLQANNSNKNCEHVATRFETRPKITAKLMLHERQDNGIYNLIIYEPCSYSSKKT